MYQKIATPDWFLQEEYVIPFLMDSYRVLIYNGVNDWVRIVLLLLFLLTHSVRFAITQVSLRPV